LGLRDQRSKFFARYARRLIFWAEHEFRLRKPLPEGGTLRDAFASYRKQTGKRHPEERASISFPDGLEYLWRWYQELEGSRPFANGAMLPIPASEYMAWQQIAGVRLRPWEVNVLRALDAGCLKVALEKKT
jgi:hypothetical protein